MLMMMMMMKKKGSKCLAVLPLLVAFANCILPPSPDQLNQISQLGEKYVDKQIENAINGVKTMKEVMEKSSEDHKDYVDALEKTKKEKEEALSKAQQMEAQLEQEVCNDTMQALWEECKPCLKNTCVKYYSRTCSSGSGLVGRQLEEVLNRTSPLSIWINGENLGDLQREGLKQDKRFQDLEDHYSEVYNNVDNMFLDSMKVFDHMQDHMRSLQSDLFAGPFRMPSLWWPFRGTQARVARSPFHGIQSSFFPMPDMSGLFSSMMEMDTEMDAPTGEDGSVNEDVVITKPSGSGQMTCREIRRNSAGCIKLRDECQKCKDIQHIDCSGRRPLEGPLKEGLEEALTLAERLTQEYSALMRRFEQRMMNTSSILDTLNQHFSWVSSLANRTRTKDGFFKVQTVISQESEGQPGDQQKPVDTKVSVQLFDFPPVTFTVPGDIPWSDPKFSEVVAQKALDRYKETSVVAK